MIFSGKMAHQRLLSLLAAEGPEGLGLPGCLRRLEVVLGHESDPGVDALLTLQWQEDEPITFVVEAKAQNTPQAVQMAVMQARKYAKYAGPHGKPMILVPYLSEERLDELEREGVSGIDACGNLLVMVPGRMYVRRSGRPNRFPGGRPLNDPFSGLSAMVARVLISQERWESLSEVQDAVVKAGARISLSQVSKALSALTEERIVKKLSRTFVVSDRPLLLEKLGEAWKPASKLPSVPCTVLSGFTLPKIFEWGEHHLRPGGGTAQWAITGESSIARYEAFSQSGPLQVVVPDLQEVIALQGVGEASSRSFADVVFIQTTEPGYYFGNEVDEEGNRWASQLQTWLELQTGDARQQDAARDLKKQLMARAKNDHE
ncbi:MAG: hypothetical protein JWO82_2188 [Akkermansiaceae bacterium]|nr:hypothetical protein [Akkermansiaceae bacterium]